MLVNIYVYLPSWNKPSAQSVVIKMGKKSEQISIDKKDFSTWWSVLQQAYCFGESLEFNDEEDDICEHCHV